MSRATIKAGVLAIVTSVVPRTYGYEPQTIEPPAAYVLADGGDATDKGQLLIDAHRFKIRLVLRWTQNEQAELQLDSYLDSLPAALRSRLTDGGGPARITLAEIGGTTASYTGYTTTYWNVNGILFRVCDFAVTVLQKR
jgi:hypothetical protein